MLEILGTKLIFPFQIYVMTVRLSAMFEEHIKKITSNWRVAKKRLRCRSSSSESADVDVTSSDENKSSNEVETIKVVVEKIEPIENGGLAAYDSDSDNTPLGALRGASISNTESDNTQDKTPLDRNSELQKRLMPNGTQEYQPEPSTSSQSILDDFDHNYTCKKSKANNCDNNQPSTSSLYHSDSSENETYHPTRKLKTKILESESDGSADIPCKANSKTSSGSDSEESVNLLELQSGLRAKQKKLTETDDQDEDFSPEESSSSSDHPAPSKRKTVKRIKRKSNSSDSDFELSDSKRKARRKRKPSFVVEDDEEEDEEETESSPTNNSDSDSDYSEGTRPQRKGRRRSKKIRKQKSDTDSDSDSALRPRKRRRKATDSDLDNRQTNGRMKYLGNVSSRGRVRKITEKAAAFLKKDKKTG